MEHTIMDRGNVEELTEEELFDLYGEVIREVQSREKIEEFNHRLEN